MKMKISKLIKKTIYSLILIAGFSNATWSQCQLVYSEGFESTCSNYYTSFQTGCIPGWISTSGSPDTHSNFPSFSLYQGARYAHMYARYDYTCYPLLEQSEGIALNYNFQAGVTYKITYAARGSNGANPAAQVYSANWILTNGLVNKFGGVCTAGESTPAIPSGSQGLPPTVYNINSWTVNQHTFTPTSNFSQLWFRHNITSTTFNSIATSIMAIDDIKIEIVCTPNSTISGASSFCENTPISLVGSVTNCSVTNNVWTVVESDQYGNVVSGATEWWSPWASGLPGTLNIPSASSGGPTMTCGKYYKIKLAVQNSCVAWTETSKVIYIKCPPSIKLKGSTVAICTGDNASLIANLLAGSGNPANCTLNWTPISPAGPTIYNGPMASVNVSPTQTTTYLATVTDNTTGCSTSAQWTVNVTNNDPSFTLTVNTTNSSYFTLSASANYFAGFSIPGFGYYWRVEELDASNNVIFYFNNPNCWWFPLSTPNVFSGIDCVSNSYSGASTISNCTIPAVGQFLYGHKYRITRGVWSDQCPWKQFSITVTPVKTANGIELVEDHTAPDFSALSSASIEANTALTKEVSIYPNPSTGLYTIELATTENSTIEIYNVFGAKVKTISQTAAKTKLDLTGFSKGIYWVSILSNGEQSRTKIILE
jgi:hypothetical protein